MGADIVCFPEAYPYLAFAEGDAGTVEASEPLDGPGITGMGAHARRLGIYILWATSTLEGDCKHNSLVLLDRSGTVAGVYRKMHPTIGEIDGGTMPGDVPGLFDTDFGRIGCCICFDLNFHDTMEGLKGSEVVFFSSAYRGGLQIQMWAWMLGAFFVSATWGELGVVVDRGGRVLSESSWEEPVIAQRVNLDSAVMHLDENEVKATEMLARYGAGIRLHYYDRERMWVVAAEREGLSIGDVVKEFGLELRDDYFARSIARLEQAKKER
jgi:predicted amidohydrolase